MGCTIGGAGNCHLDPWHKMLFGWSEPRLVALRAGGVVDIPAAQLGSADGPVLLFDSTRGGSEFFLIEYRSRSTPSGAGYDDNVSGNGMVLWHFAVGQPLTAEGSPALLVHLAVESQRPTGFDGIANAKIPVRFREFSCWKE